MLVVEHTLASSLEIRGGELGLSVIPGNAELFNIGNMYPGKDVTSTVRINNEGQDDFLLAIGVEKKHGDDLLFHGVDISISSQGEGQIYYSGPMSGISELRVRDIKAGTAEYLDLKVSLSPEKGNEYQGKLLDVTWTFSASWPGDNEIIVVRPEDSAGTDKTEPGDDEIIIVHQEDPGGIDETEAEIRPERPVISLPRTGADGLILLGFGLLTMASGFLSRRGRGVR
jgi:hypothetical protein